MPESSIVVFASGTSQNHYRDLGIDKESLSIFSCAEAEGVIGRLKANVVLIDCGVMAGHGLALLREIKARHPQIPVIFLTDASSEETAIAAFRSGAREYLPHPVDRVALRKAIIELVTIRRKTSETRLPLFTATGGKAKWALTVDAREVQPWLREALSYIEDNLAEKLTLSSLAIRTRRSKYHFSRYFRKRIGQSPMKYLNVVRVQRARELLGRRDLTVSEIAHKVGYDDPGALIRHFKKAAGVTPAAYRKRLDRKPKR